MNKPARLLIAFCIFLFADAVSAQNAQTASGGNASGSGGTVSYTIGQAVYSFHSGPGANISQGVQQPYEISVVTAIKSSDKIIPELIIYPNPVSYTRKNDVTHSKEYGFIAQEVEGTLNSLGSEQTGIISVDDSGIYSLRYNDLLAPMVKAIQEQQVTLEAYKARINTLEEINIQLENRLKATEEKIKH